MKAPGIRARKTGTKLKRGSAVQIMCYPRPKTKAVLVEASSKANRPLSSFMVLASLREAAVIEGCKIEDLIPLDELQQYGKIAPSLRAERLQTNESGSMVHDGAGSFVDLVRTDIAAIQPQKPATGQPSTGVDPMRSAAARRAWITIRAKSKIDHSDSTAA